MPTISRTATWSDMSGGPALCDQLDQHGVEYTRVSIPTIVGLGGTAYWVAYVSPLSGQPVATLCVPHHVQDSFSEDYYYLDGVTEAEAHDVDWVAVYDAGRAMDEAALRREEGQ